MKKLIMVPIFLVAIVAMVVGVRLTDLRAQDAEYVGVKKCKVCHSKEKLGGVEYQSWEQTAHAKALETLKAVVKAEAKSAANLDPQKDYSSDPECLKCHTTGYGKPAAAGSDGTQPNLDGVQCEACHGPGSKYKSPKIMSKKKYKEDREAARKENMAVGLILPTEEVCTGCHNQESPNFKEFDFKAMVEEVKHKKAAGSEAK